MYKSDLEAMILLASSSLMYFWSAERKAVSSLLSFSDFLFLYDAENIKLFEIRIHKIEIKFGALLMSRTFKS